MTRSAVVGAVIGVVVAALARGWMRLIASEPEFTWGGTIAIAAMFTLLGLLTGLVGAALASGRSGWWRIAAIPGLGAFLAQGIVVLPLALLSAAVVAITVRIADDQGTNDLALTSAGMLALGLLGGIGWGRVLRHSAR
ncbi:hypothetical protein [Nocardioides currus]|uniref:Uncharacterized protein n=1 Tax=Nocardioides currus TaxID=2133958 RepID=A0A2R7YY58_9ACTN|nr:hypothetical protein [Nocardioides currus]PUA81312.1 hypothetical protein C7S10_09845 [Nocardioides currus]